MKYALTTKKTKQGDITFITITTDHYRFVLCDFGASIYEISYIGDLEETLLTLTPKYLEDFMVSEGYYGKTVGRTSGRLFSTPIKINNKTYHLNPFISQDAMLHGGAHGFSFKRFSIKDISKTQDDLSIHFISHMRHMEDGLPGELDLEVVYHIKADQLLIRFFAHTTETTLCNITNHTYFTFGMKDEKIDRTLLKIDSHHYLDVDDNYHFKDIKDSRRTCFDFKEQRSVSEAMSTLSKTPYKGLDHVFMFDQTNTLELYHPITGHGMLVETSYPSVVLYSHNYPDNIPFKLFKDDRKHHGIAVECQFEPSGIHHPSLHSAILEPEETYQHFISYQFFRKEAEQ